MISTGRLDLRLPVEADRAVFIELFGQREFMVFSHGPLSPVDASARFDAMLAMGEELPFAKQPVIERASGMIVGYCGVAWMDFEDRRWLEFGYRLVPRVRGIGYATEAAQALVAVASRSFTGDVLATIDPTNHASKRVARKLGFEYWKLAIVGGFEDEVYRLRLDGTASASPMLP